MTGKTLLWAAMALCVLIGAGCHQKPYKKKFFMLDGAQQAPAPHEQIGRALQVRAFTMTAPYGSKGFIYRTGSYTYETDFYNLFMVEPGVLAAEKTRDWMVQSGLFKYAGGSISRIEYEYVLSGNIAELYGDFREVRPAYAVMKIEFVLTHHNKPMLVKMYAEKCPLPSKDAEGLAAAYDQCMERILRQLGQDMRAAANATAK